MEKKFWYRHTQDWDGLVSEPVKINWKKGKDLTGGLTDAAVKLHEARQKTTDRKKEVALPEYKDLAKKIETASDASVSFFGLFAFVSGYRWVSAEESAEAEKKDKEALAKIKAGEKIEEEEDDDDEDPQDYQETEVFPGGDEVATIIAEDMWPNALRYYSTCTQGTLETSTNESQRSTSSKTARSLTMRSFRSSMSTWMKMTTPRARRSISARLSVRARRTRRTASPLQRSSARLRKLE